MDNDNDDYFVYMVMSFLFVLLTYLQTLSFEDDAIAVTSSDIEVAMTIFSLSQTRAARMQRPQTLDFWTTIFPVLQDIPPTVTPHIHDYFHRYFRVTRATFSFIINRLRMHQNYQNQNRQTPIEQQVAV